MSPVVRTRLVVGLVALIAAGTVAGVVYATRQTPEQPKAQCKHSPKPFLVPGVPSSHVEAVRLALAQPPKAAAHALEPIALRDPNDPVVQFNFGSALYCAGYLADAAQAYRAAKKAGYDTYYEIQADATLPPQFSQQGPPIFEPQGNDPLLLQGVVLQRQGRQHSAERLYERAAKLHPDQAEGQVAAAVGRFDEDNLSASFSRLGPLTKRFPRSQTVRFHLGLLLAWTGQRNLAVREFRLARSLGPATRLGKESDVFLRGLVPSGTKG